MTPANHRCAITTDEAKPSSRQFFCNNCFKPANELVPDGQFPVCQKCLAEREDNRK